MVAHAPAPHGGACAWFARELNIDKTGLKFRVRSEGARRKRKRARQETEYAYPAKLSRLKNTGLNETDCLVDSGASSHIWNRIEDVVRWRTRKRTKFKGPPPEHPLAYRRPTGGGR